jgi:hypothetical protein
MKRFPELKNVAKSRQGTIFQVEGMFNLAGVHMDMNPPDNSFLENDL